MSTDDEMNWTLTLELHTTDILYGFLINDLHWIPDTNTTLVTYQDVIFSVYKSEGKAKRKVELVSGELCKDFSADLKAPLHISDSFTNLDKYVCFWLNYDNLLEDSLIKVELVNPLRQVHIVDYQILDNTKNGNIFYCAVPINETMSSGKWLIYVSSNGIGIFEKEFEYKVLKNSYLKINSSIYHTNLRYDLKG